MQSGIIPAIISFFLPGLGQAVTDGKPRLKWAAVFIVIYIIESLLLMFLGMTIGGIIGLIINLIFAYDAYANMIDLS